jgi:hypothetical protein
MWTRRSPSRPRRRCFFVRKGLASLWDIRFFVAALAYGSQEEHVPVKLAKLGGVVTPRFRKNSFSDIGSGTSRVSETSKPSAWSTSPQQSRCRLLGLPHH